MIDVTKAKIEFKKFLDEYKKEEQDTIGFNLKVIHTYQVTSIARLLATKLNLDSEDIDLAELIGLLHDIGRFEEITVTKRFDNVSFDHASHGVKMLFQDNMIRRFISDNKYDSIIKTAIDNHSRLSIEKGLDDIHLLHSKIIRDADKLDNFRIKNEQRIETLFPGKVNNASQIEDSTISDSVYESIMNKECVRIEDRVTPLDYLVCVLGFAFDLNFDESFEIMKENDYINRLVGRFNYKDQKTAEKMRNISNVINEYIIERTSKIKSYEYKK